MCTLLRLQVHHSSTECAVDKVDLSYIPGVAIRDFEVEVAKPKGLRHVQITESNLENLP